ncbi:hypothetical protein ACFXGU_19350, partial [Streptomyces scopuliridis]
RRHPYLRWTAHRPGPRHSRTDRTTTHAPVPPLDGAPPRAPAQPYGPHHDARTRTSAGRRTAPARKHASATPHPLPVHARLL